MLTIRPKRKKSQNLSKRLCRPSLMLTLRRFLRSVTKSTKSLSRKPKLTQFFPLCWMNRLSSIRVKCWEPLKKWNRNKLSSISSRTRKLRRLRLIKKKWKRHLNPAAQHLKLKLKHLSILWPVFTQLININRRLSTRKLTVFTAAQSTQCPNSWIQIHSLLPVQQPICQTFRLLSWLCRSRPLGLTLWDRSRWEKHSSWARSMTTWAPLRSRTLRIRCLSIMGIPWQLKTTKIC